MVDLREAPNTGQSDADKAGHEQSRMSKKQTAKMQSKKWKKKNNNNKNLDCRAPGTKDKGRLGQYLQKLMREVEIANAYNSWRQLSK